MSPLLLLLITLLLMSTNAAGPLDPPFDLTRVLFSAVFSSQMVLQRAPSMSAVFGTATPGASIIVTVDGPNGFSYTSAPSPVVISSDLSIHGTWRTLLKPMNAGFGYNISAACTGCTNSSAPSAAISGVGFGDVFLCSGQSNMECPLLTTLSRFDVYNKTSMGLYDHIRLFQTGARYLGPRNTSSWILPSICEPSPKRPCPNNTEPDSGGISPAYRSWILPRGEAGNDDEDFDGFPNRFSAVCWYFGMSLSDMRAAEAAKTGSSDQVPIGLIASSVGGTTIQQWLPPWANGNETCSDNNCGWVEQLDPSKPEQPAGTPQCMNETLSNVYSCPSGTCSTLWHSMIAPYVNMTIAGATWYQGEQNQIYSGGDATSGYLCQQNALISSWRAAFSSTPGTTLANMPFGVTTLAGAGGEGFPLWSPFLHTTQDVWRDCYVNRRRTPVCNDISDDSMGLIRLAQSGGAGFFPASSNVFLAQAHDLGEPCNCDARAQAPGGCWANGQCFGTGPYSLNITHNYELSGIHPRPKLQVGQRLARGYLGLQSGGASVPKIAGCRLSTDGSLVTLTFDSTLLQGDSVSLQPPAPGLIPLQVRTGPPTSNSSGWVYAIQLQIVNSTSVSAVLPTGGAHAPDAIRYAWADSPCCPGQNPSTFFCAPESCPIVTSINKEPAVPFYANIIQGKCVCDAPFSCNA